MWAAALCEAPGKRMHPSQRLSAMSSPGARRVDRFVPRPGPNDPSAPAVPLTIPKRACPLWRHRLRTAQPGRRRVEQRHPIPGLHPEAHHPKAQSGRRHGATRLHPVCRLDGVAGPDDRDRFHEGRDRLAELEGPLSGPLSRLRSHDSLGGPDRTVPLVSSRWSGGRRAGRAPRSSLGTRERPWSKRGLDRPVGRSLPAARGRRRLGVHPSTLAPLRTRARRSAGRQPVRLGASDSMPGSTGTVLVLATTSTQDRVSGPSSPSECMPSPRLRSIHPSRSSFCDNNRSFGVSDAVDIRIERVFIALGPLVLADVIVLVPDLIDSSPSVDRR